MNLCPRRETYCDLSHSYETCLFHSTEAHCVHRKKYLRAEA